MGTSLGSINLWNKWDKKENWTAKCASEPPKGMHFLEESKKIPKSIPETERNGIIWTRMLGGDDHDDAIAMWQALKALIYHLSLCCTPLLFLFIYFPFSISWSWKILFFLVQEMMHCDHRTHGFFSLMYLATHHSGELSLILSYIFKRHWMV